MNCIRVNVTLPKDLLDFADRQTKQDAAKEFAKPSRSRWFSRLIIQEKNTRDRKAKQRKLKAA